VYFKDRGSHPEVKMFTISPAAPFVLPRVAASPPLKSFQGTVFRGHLERGGKTISGLQKVTVNIDKIVHFHKFDPAVKAPGAGARPSGRRSKFDEERYGDDGVRITIGKQDIRVHPASKFTWEETQAGGLMVCFTNGAEGEWGVVEPGHASQIFLEKGQCVEFDANGQVIMSEGISHVYSGLYATLISDESVQDATEASPTKEKRR